MGRYHALFAGECLRLNICKGLIAQLDSKLAGVGVYYTLNTIPKKVGVIYYVSVLSEYRRKGLGKSLVMSMEELMTIDNVSICIATTKHGNEVIRHMFKDLGYVEIPFEGLGNLLEHIEKLTCGYDDDLLLIKYLDGSNASSNDLMFLVNEYNTNIINEVWRSICYNVWLRRKQLMRYYP